MYNCPKCGDELNFDDKVYRDFNGVVLGCQFCIDRMDAEDALEDWGREWDE